MFRKKVTIKEIVLVRPEFKVHLVDKDHKTRKHKSTGGLQSLYGDILNRGVIHNFRLEGASVEARDKSDSVLIAQLNNYSLEANEIETDSVQIRQVIPFKVGRLHSSLDSGYFHMNDYMELRTGHV